MRRRLSAKAKLLLFVFGLTSLYGGWYAGQYYARVTFTPAIISLYPEPAPLPHFSLRDHQGGSWDPGLLLGGWSILLPADLSHKAALEPLLYDLSRLHNRLGQYPQLHESMRYLLITALPETTDTGLEALRPLVAGYSRAFHAIGGDQPTIEQLLNALDDATSLGTERFSWGGKLLLIDPDGKLMGEFPRTFDPVALSEEFHELTSFRP